MRTAADEMDAGRLDPDRAASTITNTMLIISKTSRLLAASPSVSCGSARGAPSHTQQVLLAVQRVGVGAGPTRWRAGHRAVVVETRIQQPFAVGHPGQPPRQRVYLRGRDIPSEH